MNNFLNEIEKIKQDKKKKKKKAYRESKSDVEKDLERKLKAEQMKKMRDIRTPERKQLDRKLEVKRIKKIRETKSPEEKEGDRIFAVERMKKVRETKKSSKENAGALERLIKFRHAVKYGAIFICSSCHQRLFENGVSLITSKFKEGIENKTPGLYRKSTEEIIQFIKKKPQYNSCRAPVINTNLSDKY